MSKTIFKSLILLRQSVFSGFVRRYLATPGILSRLRTYVYTVYFIFMACNKGRNKLQYYILKSENGHTVVFGYLDGVNQKLSNTL